VIGPKGDDPFAPARRPAPQFLQPFSAESAKACPEIRHQPDPARRPTPRPDRKAIRTLSQSDPLLKTGRAGRLPKSFPPGLRRVYSFARNYAKFVNNWGFRVSEDESGDAEGRKTWTTL